MRIYVTKLQLYNFRNYVQLTLNLLPKNVVINGANGAGKTNILEALSLLAPGKGLRSTKLFEADMQGQNEAWVVSANLAIEQKDLNSNSFNSPDLISQQKRYLNFSIGTTRENSENGNKRIIKIDGKKIKNQNELNATLSVLWLTPQMDGLFNQGVSNRRKFLDQLVQSFDSGHSSRIFSYEYSLNERRKLLDKNGDPTWLNVLEQKMAEHAIAIACARQSTIDIINDTIKNNSLDFPKAILSVNGEVEKLLQIHKAQDAEQILKNRFTANRKIDQINKRTNIGTHKSDFSALHVEKNMPAFYCSTGEQKALLISIILAKARARILWQQSPPILLFDEATSHLDNRCQNQLFAEILEIGTQAWFTGTDKKIFDFMNKNAQFLYVEKGEVS